MNIIIRKQLTFIFRCILVFMLIVSCQSEKRKKTPLNPPSEIKPTENVICPLAVGNYWTYIDSSIGFYDYQADTSKLEITGKTTISFDNQVIEVFFWNWINLKTKIPEDWKWLNRNEDDGLWTYGILSSTDTLLVKNLDIKYPIELSESWKSVLIYDSFKVSDTLTITCIGIEEPFKTPLGIFYCYVYYYKMPYPLQRSWHKFGLPQKQFRLIIEKMDSRLIKDEFYLFLDPQVGYVGMVEIVNGVLVWKKVLLDYSVRLE
ncbi:MAG: hypothetical protein JSW07_18315 [bacterium]|nr:MAG: hypothetical protein JSW07_18315 [bacterium]